MNEVEKMLAIKARNAAIVGGSNLGQDKPMLYEDQIPKVATNAEILAAIRARHAAAMRGEKVEYQTTEQDIVAAGANVAPRVTPADIEASIASEHYFTAADGVTGAKFNAEPRQTVGIDTSPLPLHLLTFCVLVLRNGFTVTGESACASPENFNAEIGRRIARENAAEKIWPLLGFRLRDELARPVLTEADAAADLAGVQGQRARPDRLSPRKRAITEQ